MLASKWSVDTKFDRIQQTTKQGDTGSKMNLTKNDKTRERCEIQYPKSLKKSELMRYHQEHMCAERTIPNPVEIAVKFTILLLGPTLSDDIKHIGIQAYLNQNILTSFHFELIYKESPGKSWILCTVSHLLGITDFYVSSEVVVFCLDKPLVSHYKPVTNNWHISKWIENSESHPRV